MKFQIPEGLEIEAFVAVVVRLPSGELRTYAVDSVDADGGVDGSADVNIDLVGDNDSAAAGQWLDDVICPVCLGEGGSPFAPPGWLGGVCWLCGGSGNVTRAQVEALEKQRGEEKDDEDQDSDI